MKFLISTNPTPAQLEARTNLNRVFIKVRIESAIMEMERNALTDLEYASLIALAIEFDLTELTELLQMGLSSHTQRMEVVSC